jgi:MFS transporter, FSR family, fosmidomycin resistance protein
MVWLAHSAKILRMSYRLYLLPVLAKSFTVDFFVLLPVLYAHKIISSAEIGYFGAVSIGMLVLGALVISRWLHNVNSKDILLWGSALATVSTLMLGIGLWLHALWLILFSYALSGVMVGFSMSATNALVANHTNKDNRYAILARSSMFGDMNRITFPLIVVLALKLGGLSGVIVVMLLLASVLTWATVTLPNEASTSDEPELPPAKLRHNRSFKYFLSMEFLDSFASSQLFVFIPVLFLAKGYSLQSSLVLQTAIFLGYLSGRWIIGRLASKLSGSLAVAIAETGMVVTILLLLVVQPLPLLYLLTWLLGVFARGTSPVIKALVFNSLHEAHVKQGSAMHVVAGDSGSALGQLSFGLLLAWIGVSAPFIAAAIVASFVAIFCLASMRRVSVATPAT